MGLLGSNHLGYIDGFIFPALVTVAVVAGGILLAVVAVDLITEVWENKGE